MYEAFYGFKEKPFSMLPDPDFLYLSKKHQAALTLLEYGLLNHVGFCVLSGEAGAGKTTILRALLERAGDDVTVGLITNTHQSFGGLLDWVLSAFDLHQPNLTHVEMHQIFMEYLIEEYANNRTVLLIVDEAQNMKADALEELRMLSNVNSDKDQLMQVVLAGQPALKETLRMPELMQFAQRIAVDYHLEPLGLEETCGYIQHRLITAGAQTDVFTPAACERIHNYSGGTPRLINLLCETVLVYGFADQQKRIDVDLVDEMVLERMKDSVVPIVNRGISNTDTKVNEQLEKDFPWIQPKDGTAGLKADAVEQQQAADENVSSATAEKEPEVPAGVNEAESSTDDKKQQSKVDVAASKLKDSGKGTAAKRGRKREAPTSAPSSAGAAPEKSEKDAENVIFSAKSDVPVVIKKTDDDTRAQLIKYGAIAGILALVLVVFALLLEDDTSTGDLAENEAAELKKQRELEEKQLRQLQIEAETLKRERDAAIANAEAERLAKEKSEKLAVEKAALAVKAEAERQRQEELKRIAAAKESERQAKKAAARAKAEADRARRESARLAKERREMQARLDEERRLKLLEEARRQELEKKEIERQALEAAEEKISQQAIAEENLKKENKSERADCTGPTARFKAGCR